MLGRRVVLVISIALLGSLLGPARVFADPPGLPSLFYGTVDVLRADLSGAQVVAYVRGVEAGRCSVRQVGALGPTYVIDVVADDPSTVPTEGGQTGDRITFRVRLSTDSTYTMVQTANWLSGGIEKLDLESPRVNLPLIRRS